MSTIKIRSQVNNGKTTSIKLRTNDAPKTYYDDNTLVNGPYNFYALDDANIGDVVTHLDLRDTSKSVNPPAADYSDYYMYSSINTNPGVPDVVEVGMEKGDNIYNGIWDTLSIKKQSIIDFGNEIGNGFTLSTWIKISNNNPNWDWYIPISEGGLFGDASKTKTIQSHLFGTVSTANNMIFGISMNRGAEGDRDKEERGNTLFFIRSADGKYTTGYITANIQAGKWINLTWTAKIDPSQDKMVFDIYIDGYKVEYYPIDEEINSTSTWDILDNGLGIGLWSRTDSDSNTEFVSLIDLAYNNIVPDSNSAQTNSHGKFQISTLTLYRKALSYSEVFSDYKYYKERYKTIEDIDKGLQTFKDEETKKFHIKSNKENKLFYNISLDNENFKISSNNELLSTTSGYIDNKGLLQFNITPISSERIAKGKVNFSFDNGEIVHEFKLESVRSIVANGLKFWMEAGSEACYPGTGTTVNDLSGLNNNGTIFGDIYFDSTDGVGSFVFDGSSDYISVPHSTFIKPTEQITFSAYAYRDNWNTNVNEDILSLTEYGGYAIELYQSKLRIMIRIAGSYTYCDYPVTSLPSSGWINIAATYDGQNVIVYVDGNQVITVQQTGTISYDGDNSLIIGGEAGSTTSPDGNYWNGKIARVLIYDRALTQEEISQISQ